MWDVLTIIGTIAFALSGAFVAMEEDYDLMGVYILGLVTAFGGGAVRNLLIGIPVSALWEQGSLFIIAIVVMSIAFIFPSLVNQWGKFGLLFDAIGLAAFAIQGALYATEMGHPLPAVIVAAALTGTGGGMIRDVLAGRKPLFLQKEIYIAWAMLAGVIIGLNLATSSIGLSILFFAVIILRMMSVHFKWQLPRQKLMNITSNQGMKG
jgi:uncharacterized membrane protein YeiH